MAKCWFWQHCWHSEIQDDPDCHVSEVWDGMSLIKVRERIVYRVCCRCGTKTMGG